MAIAPTRFIRQHQYGILSTHSQRYYGFPFGSVVPYLISPSGRVAIFISDLAEHTKNILADSKVALTISEADHNPIAQARMTLLANAEISQQQEQLRALYQQQFQDADTILGLGGFQFFELELVAVRLIAGFGEIGWLAPEQLDLQTD
jgi:hypothetical protein